jgi:ankyrin repeat protein
MRDALDEGGELGSMDEQDGELKTALHHAVSASSIECIDELLSRGL